MPGGFNPNNKGKFKTVNGKRVFPASWYAAQAARRKKNPDGTYKEGQYKESNKAPDQMMLPGRKPKRKMPDSWYENQKKRAAERKEAEARGEYTRKVRGKQSEYNAKARAERDSRLKIEKDGTRRVTLDSYEQRAEGISFLYKGHRCDVRTKKGTVETVTIKGPGIYPMTRVGITKNGSVEIVDTNNIVAGYFH